MSYSERNWDDVPEMDLTISSIPFIIQPQKLNINFFKWELLEDHPEVVDRFTIWLNGREFSRNNYKLYLLEKV